MLPEDLIELHEKLSAFATHYRNKGGQEAHKIIKKKLIDDVRSLPRDASKEGVLRDLGYDTALKDVLSLLHSVFVP